MVRQGHCVALVVAFLIGCAFLLLAVGCAGTSSETSKKGEQGSSPEATASEEARCEGTRTIKSPKGASGGSLLRTTYRAAPRAKVRTLAPIMMARPPGYESGGHTNDDAGLALLRQVRLSTRWLILRTSLLARNAQATVKIATLGDAHAALGE